MAVHYGREALDINEKDRPAFKVRAGLLAKKPDLRKSVEHFL